MYPNYNNERNNLMNNVNTLHSLRFENLENTKEYIVYKIENSPKRLKLMANVPRQTEQKFEKQIILFSKKQKKASKKRSSELKKKYQLTEKNIIKKSLHHRLKKLNNRNDKYYKKYQPFTHIERDDLLPSDLYLIKKLKQLNLKTIPTPENKKTINHSSLFLNSFVPVKTKRLKTNIKQNKNVAPSLKKQKTMTSRDVDRIKMINALINNPKTVPIIRRQDGKLTISIPEVQGSLTFEADDIDN
ncbi:hypothetical protein CDIK_2153 [Cucumispora dikerogammari]|nr:hypothetical protein CDIK_2153 [Cucumispora dikerogammari]